MIRTWGRLHPVMFYLHSTLTSFSDTCNIKFVSPPSARSRPPRRTCDYSSVNRVNSLVMGWPNFSALLHYPAARLTGRETAWPIAIPLAIPPIARTSINIG
jgi:hypothetical protein